MPITFYLYANDEEEIRRLQESLYEFVLARYNEGVLVTADRLSSAVRKFGENNLVKNYFNGK